MALTQPLSKLYNVRFGSDENIYVNKEICELNYGQRQKKGGSGVSGVQRRRRFELHLAAQAGRREIEY
jgi:hypothetical protein